MYLSDIAKNNLEEKKEMQKEKSMVDRILDSQSAGYAYLYPSGGGNRQEFFISKHPGILQIFWEVICMMQIK